MKAALAPRNLSAWRNMSLASLRISAFLSFLPAHHIVSGREWTVMAESLRVPLEPEFQHSKRLRAQDGLCIIESHCPICGAFIAAGQSIKLIHIAEQFHSCPASCC